MYNVVWHYVRVRRRFPTPEIACSSLARVEHKIFPSRTVLKHFCHIVRFQFNTTKNRILKNLVVFLAICCIAKHMHMSVCQPSISSPFNQGFSYEALPKYQIQNEKDTITERQKHKKIVTQKDNPPPLPPVWEWHVCLREKIMFFFAF